MKLILVESPTKAKTLSKFLKGKYDIIATMGHIRDLPKSVLGVDIEHGFAPSYVIPKDRKKQVNAIVALSEKADLIILATDPDREGEAIAWHLSEIIRQKNSKSDPVRIAFHEITEHAIAEALAHPRTIDMKLVSAQQARRMLDRLVGYTLSPLLWKKLSKRWLSAGRVQSVAVRLIVEREREIAAFFKEPYCTIEAEFHSDTAGEHRILKAQLFSKDGVKYEKQMTFHLFDGIYTTTKTTIPDEKEALRIIQDFQAPFLVDAVEKKEVKRAPPAPYTTSTLQQDAGRRLYFSSKKTMQLAQKLYEEGYITYHRTDSLNVSEKFLGEARICIEKTFGREYLPETAKRYHTKSKVAQEAHEAIRPTNITLLPDAVKHEAELNHEHARLYSLIWKRALASQMREAVFDSTTIRIENANAYVFQTQGSVLKFDGFLKVTGRENGEVILPPVSIGEPLILLSPVSIMHETPPPPRYSEASLVKALEENNIGRPSTYAPVISTIMERQYVKKDEKKLVPTELGGLVTDFLIKYFSDIMNLPFTAKMEGDLDAIAAGDRETVPVLAEFYGPFQKALDHAVETAEKVKISEEKLDETCPKCQGQLVIRTGRYGKFVACSNFPACTYTRQYGDITDLKCPVCKSSIVIKRTRREKTFYGCSSYPNCTFAAWKKEDIQ